MQPENRMSVQEEEIVLGIHFDAGDCGDESKSEESDDEGGIVIGTDGLPQFVEGLEKKKHEKITRRNADPIEQPKPNVKYEKRVPRPSTSIAIISYKRLDRITTEHARLTDACLICARDLTSQPNIRLYQLPCRHAWCKECLARAFHFVLSQRAFGRLQCCAKKDIPLEYFERIVENKSHPPVEHEVRPDPKTTAENEDNLWNSTKVVEYVEKDQEVFISPGDMASYRTLLEEHQVPSRVSTLSA